MTEEEDESSYPPKLAPRDLTRRTGDATKPPGTAPVPDQNGAESIVCTVIEHVAETLEEDPTRMRPPLGAVIDPEILVRLQRTGERSEQTYTFTYRDLVVRATSNGAVSVRRLPSNRSS